MANRGRGGKTTSLTQEQLQALGCVGKDAPDVVAAPPPTYPPLMSKPITPEMTAAQNYQILWKEDFLNHMRDSPYFLTPLLERKSSSVSNTIFDRFQNENKTKGKAEFQWHLMPSELQPMNKKRRTLENKQKISKKIKSENIQDRLKALEEKERSEKDVEANNKDGSDSEHEEEEEEVAIDEEMDEENDYGNNYFDNGEAYNEEDDNLDDGPVY